MPSVLCKSTGGPVYYRGRIVTYFVGHVPGPRTEDRAKRYPKLLKLNQLFAKFKPDLVSEGISFDESFPTFLVKLDYIIYVRNPVECVC